VTDLKLIENDLKAVVQYPSKPELQSWYGAKQVIDCLDWHYSHPNPEEGYSDDELAELSAMAMTQVDETKMYLDRLADAEARADSYAAEFLALRNRIKDKRKKIETGVRDAMLKKGFKFLQGKAFTIIFKKPSEKFHANRQPTGEDWMNAAMEKFVRAKTTYEWNAVALKAAMKGGADFDFAAIKRETPEISFEINKGVLT